MHVFVSALIILGQAALPPAQVDTAKVSEAVRAEMQRTRSPGVAVGVVIDGRLVFARGYGSTSVETLNAVTPATLFRIGSVTKSITGVTALTSAHNGRVALEQPIASYFREIHPSLGQISLRHLLTHTGGMTQMASAYGPSDEAALQRRVLAWNDSVLFAGPGEVYSYSSVGYWLAAAVLERAENAKYSELVRRHVFDPLGMSASTFDPLVAFTHATALDHRRDAQGNVSVVRPYPNDASTWAGGSAFSNINELSRFAIALLNGGRIDDKQAIPASVAQSMMTRQAQNAATSCGYTFGLGFCIAGRDTVVSHYGFRSGSGAVFTLVPSKRAAIIILANTGGAIFFQTERAVLDMLGVMREPAQSSQVRDIAKTEFSRITGTYAAGSDTLHIYERAARLVLGYRAEAPQPLRMGASNELFTVDEKGEPSARWMLVRSEKGNWFLSDGLNAFRRIATSSTRH